MRSIYVWCYAQYIARVSIAQLYAQIEKCFHIARSISEREGVQIFLFILCSENHYTVSICRVEDYSSSDDDSYDSERSSRKRKRRDRSKKVIGMPIWVHDFHHLPTFVPLLSFDASFGASRPGAKAERKITNTSTARNPNRGAISTSRKR